MNNILLIAGIIGGFYVLNNTKSSSTKKSVNKPKPIVDNGFDYNCKEIKITNIEKYKAYTVNLAKEIVEKFNITSFEKFKMIDVKSFTNAIIEKVNKNCAKIEVDKNDRISKFVVIVTITSGISEELKKKLNIQESILEEFILKLKQYYKLSDEEFVEAMKLIINMFPEDFKEHVNKDTGFTFDCNQLVIIDETLFEEYLQKIAGLSLISLGYSNQDPSALLQDNFFDKFVVKMLSYMGPSCAIETIGDEAFIWLVGTSIAIYRNSINANYLGNMNAMENSNLQIKLFYDKHGVTIEAEQEIESLAEEILKNSGIQQI